jgi:hypothetical protein
VGSMGYVVGREVVELVGSEGLGDKCNDGGRTPWIKADDTRCYQQRRIPGRIRRKGEKNSEEHRARGEKS